jgi:hypothetical protein
MGLFKFPPNQIKSKFYRSRWNPKNNSGQDKIITDENEITPPNIVSNDPLTMENLIILFVTKTYDIEESFFL